MQNQKEHQAPKTELTPLPFKYERTFDPSKARYSWRRVNTLQDQLPQTDKELAEATKFYKKDENWFFQDYWREKGQPQEQLEYDVNGKPITLYNFCKEKPFSDEHIELLKEAIQQLSSRFPRALDEIRWILIDNNPQASIYGDPEKFPLNGQARGTWRTFRFTPRGTEFTPHRIEAVSNFEGTFVHETSHLIQNDFLKDWSELFQWEWCQDHMDQWEFRTPPDGSKKKLFNKETGEMAPQAQFPLQPEQCINYYAKLSREEDICESIVTYIYDPELLKTVSPDKFEILARHDAKNPLPKITAIRVSKDQIELPEIKPETVYYFIREPQE